MAQRALGDGEFSYPSINPKAGSCERCGFLVPAGQGLLFERQPTRIKDVDGEQFIPKRRLIFHASEETCKRLGSEAAKARTRALAAKVARERMVSRIMGWRPPSSP